MFTKNSAYIKSHGTTTNFEKIKVNEKPFEFIYRLKKKR